MVKPKTIYLDYAAATPVDNKVLAAMGPYFSEKFYNPSAIYLSGKSARKAVNDARSKVARIIGSRPSEVVFMAGATEANNLAIAGVMNRFSNANMIISAIEHESVREPAKKYKTKEVKANENGLVSISDLEKKIDDKTVFISVIYANNEIGAVQNLKEIATFLQKIKHNRALANNSMPIYLHTDAAQAANYQDIHVKRLGVDLMTLNGGKIYGPKQSGCLYVRAGIALDPIISGGGQELGFRSGTENVAYIVGFSEALEMAQAKRKDESNRLAKLQKLFILELSKKVPKAKINGSLKRRLPNNISVTFPGIDNERLVMELDERGIMCAVGSACSASKEESSHVLRAVGLTDEQARSTLRFSMGRQTTETDIKTTVKEIDKVINA